MYICVKHYFQDDKMSLSSYHDLHGGGLSMDNAYLQMLIDLHKNNHRQGPGGDEQTLLAAQLAGLDASRPLKIADIGCGTGAASILLAEHLHAHITAVDFLPEFLDELNTRAKAHGVDEKITTVNAPMDALDFPSDFFDVIWSEGAVYNIGFERGISYWKQFLKPCGKLVLSEITWLTESRPEDLQSYWDAEYPEAGTASQNMSILEQHGYRPHAYFFLNPHCWTENYYRPLQDRFEAFLIQHNHSQQAREIVEAEKFEINQYEKYSEYYSYGVYIAQKIS